MNFHWQNLRKEDTVPGKRYPHWLHGRAWWRFGSWNNNLRIEWVVWRASVGVSLELAEGDDHVSAMVGCWLFCIFIGVSAKWLSTITRKLVGYEPTDVVRLRIFDSALWWSFWHPSMSWTRGTPRWRYGSWHPLDTVFGRMTYWEIPLITTPVDIAMPEGIYAAVIKQYVARRGRKRWPWKSETRMAEIKVEKGIPVPGKGENSWDCDDDAIFSLSTPADKIEDAIAAVVRAVYNKRRRYGSITWTPRPHAQA
jgi:hypothetical protein